MNIHKRYLSVGINAQKTYDETICPKKKQPERNKKKYSKEEYEQVQRSIMTALREDDEEGWIIVAGRIESIDGYFETEILFTFIRACTNSEIRVRVAENAIQQIMAIFISKDMKKKEFLSYILLYLASAEKAIPAYFDDVTFFLESQFNTLPSGVAKRISDIKKYRANHSSKTKRKSPHSFSNRSHKHLSPEKITHQKGGARKRHKKG